MSNEHPVRAARGPTRVLIVGEAGVFRTGLSLLLEQDPRTAAAGEASTCREAGALLPDDVHVVLIDMDAREGVEPDEIDSLVGRPGVRVLMVASGWNHEASLRAVELGAMGLVFKEKSPATLIAAIERVRAGETYFDRSMLSSAFRMASHGDGDAPAPGDVGVSALTKRELEVVALAARGLRNRQIADALFISEVTVRHHLTSIFGKLGLADRLELMKFAFEHGLAKLEE